LGLPKVRGEKFDGQEIEDDPKGSTDSILRFACTAGMVGHFQFDYFRPFPGAPHGDEPVHLAIKTEAFEHVPPIGF
jgi:hypothetical protein